MWTYHEKNGFGKQQPLEYLMRPVNMLVYEELESDRKCYKGRLEMEVMGQMELLSFMITKNVFIFL